MKDEINPYDLSSVGKAMNRPKKPGRSSASTPNPSTGSNFFRFA